MSILPVLVTMTVWLAVPSALSTAGISHDRRVRRFDAEKGREGMGTPVCFHTWGDMVLEAARVHIQRTSGSCPFKNRGVGASRRLRV